MVDGILDKEVFLDYEIVTMRQSKYWHFSKGLTYECGQKFEISSEFVSVSKRP